MFNHLTPAEVVAAIGRAAREAARGDAVASDYSRGQLLSAYSCSRHLTVELEAYGPEVRACAADVAAILREAGLGDLEETADGAQLGELVSEALDRLREDGSDTAREARERIHARLRRLAV